jgi:hypothetical protein
MVKTTLMVHGKKVPITPDTVDAFKLGYEQGFNEGVQTEAEIPGMSKAAGKEFMAIQRNTWLTAKGVDEKLRGKW